MVKQKLLVAVFTIASVFSGSFDVFAQTDSPSRGGETDFPSGGGETDPPSEGSSLRNPLGDDSDLPGFLQEILDVIMVFAVPLIVFMIIYAGFLYVTARGNETQVSNASRALLYAVIGGVIILGANIILAVISGTVDAFR